MIRRYGKPPREDQRYKARPGVYAVLPRGGHVLVTWKDGLAQEFQLPGGGIDPGEQPLAALHREVLEETGWRIGAARRLGAFRRFTFMPDYGIWAEKLCTVYLARPVRRLEPPREDGHEAVWLAPDAAASLLQNDGDRQFLVAALGVGVAR
ncbi:NUDIX domain-containing protein [Poseidonocella sedimentorum]|uniref:8-oxo-dGTP diphosphatase n=1 Tax=Poseidonocella sedimentorum TaxID=871652 RepID=A0A1I6D5Z3_9RHOB|nr:NUDIX hydrolase [Poseidonocella sedimentorum]SFR00813.1 8-oxo-dGTP diphosphatase [Poseidonocella sedimentorum]